MNIGFLSDSLSSTAGGIFEIERSLALHLRELDVPVRAWGVDDERWERDRLLWEEIACRVRKHLGPRVFGYVPGLVDDLVQSNCDLLHLQHLWMYPSVAVHRWHRLTGKPYLVTANGMLEPWTLSRSRWNKRLAAFCYENRMLHAAACLQANTEKEAADFRAYGLKNAICLIPNGVELGNAEMLKTEKRKGERKILLFLGRLHPKKGLVNALRAWKQATGNAEMLKTGNAENWQFVIAGWNQGGHEEELKKLCRELGLSYSDTPASELLTKNEEPRTKNEGPRTKNEEPSEARQTEQSEATQSQLIPRTKNAEGIAFVGPVFEDAKDALLRRADAFLLPSFSEGLPMAVLEAWAHGLPVLMTDHCNLPEGFSEGAALRIGTDSASIADGMRELFQGSSQDLEAMGARGRALVEQRFTWPKVAAQMKEVYEWILGGGAKPGCVL